MQLSKLHSRQCQQQASTARLGLSRHMRCLRCYAKRKGEQKNDGMYFTYEKVTQPDSNAGKQPSEKQKQDFGWVSSARSSVQQYRQAPYKKPNKQQQKQKQQGMSQQQPQQRQPGAQDSSTDEVLQPKPVSGKPSAATSEEQRPAAPAAEQFGQQQLAAAAVGPAAELAAAETVQVTVQQPQQQQQPQLGTLAEASSSSHSGLQPIEAVDARSQTGSPSSTSTGGSSSSRKEEILAKRKQQLLQRMKGSAAPATAGSAANAAAAATSAAAATAAAAAVPLAASMAAAETAAAADGLLPGLDAEGELLLQELFDMAQELTNPMSNNVIDNDPMADPLADVMPDYSSSSRGSGNGNGEISIADLSIAAAAGDQEAADMFAVINALQQRMHSAVAEDDDSGSGMVRVTDLLSWEADEAARNNNVTDIDLDAELAVLQKFQKGEYSDLPDGSQEGEWEYLDEYENEGEVDDSWYGNDPELKRLMAADGAAFAKMLSELNEEGAESAGSSSSSDQTEQRPEAWAGLEAQDWLEAVEDGSDSSSALEAESAAADDDALLGGVINAIESDRSLDQKAKLEARLRVQGMFNDPTAAAEGSKRRGKGSKQRQQQVSEPEQGVEKELTTTGAGAAGDGDSEVPALLPRPVRPVQ